LAKLGHNHVISTRDIQGKIYRHPLLEKSGIIVRLPVASFEIDDPVLRRLAGEEFASTPTTQDIDGTRRNMLSEKLLNAATHPHIDITSVAFHETPAHYLAQLRFEVAGNIRDIEIPAVVEETGNRILIRGSTRIKQSDLGLTPFSIMMGAISVQDEMNIEFRLLAELRD
jgi:polyisoprenoid-binding protein YceI